MQKTLPLFLLAISLMGTLGCRKQAAAPPSPIASTKQDATDDKTIYAPDDGPTVLGQQMGNPYLTTNMQSARKALDARGVRSANAFTVRTTHLYIVCTPKNEDEYDVLTADGSVDWYDTPLDYEKKIVGNWYHDPTLPDDVPTPQYAVVPVDYKFIPGLDYKVLGELYLPEQDIQLVGEKHNENAGYFKQLLEEAYTTTQIAPPPGGPNWVPADNGSGDYSGGYAAPGKIQVFDTRLNRYIPIEGVKVSARVSMFTTYHAITDWMGEYFLDGFVTNKADYAIHFQRDGFSVKRNRVTNAYVSRVNQQGSHWSYGIEGGRDRMHGHMFRAGFRYYYGDIADLPRPGRPQVSVGLVSFDVNQGVVSSDDHKTTCFTPGSIGLNLVAFPTMFVARYKNSDNTLEYGSDEIFSTTVHELAHTSHYNTMGRNLGKFLQVNSTIRESFPVAVEWLLTGMEYHSQGIAHYGDVTYDPPSPPAFPNWLAYQYWGLPDYKRAYYTSLFINLMDDFNESEHSIQFLGNGAINDRVSGYSLGQIQLQVLPHAYSISDLQSWLSVLGASNPTVSQVPLLLNQY